MEPTQSAPMPPVPPRFTPPQQPQTPSHSSSAFWYVLGGLLALFVIIGAFYYLSTDHVLAPTAQTATTTQPAQSSNSENQEWVPLQVGQTILTVEKSTGYTEDAGGIYSIGVDGTRVKIPAADPATFEVSSQSSMYARDATNVYVYGNIIPGADPASFSVICGASLALEISCAYAKDAQHVYAYTQVIPDADPQTFVSLESTGKDWTQVAIDSSAYYADEILSGSAITDPVTVTRISTLSDGTPLHFTNPAAVVATTTGEWGGYYNGVIIGSKAYYGGDYLIDGSSVYTVYRACDLDANGEETPDESCTDMISKVAKVGDLPEGLSLPVATIDQSSLTTTSATPTITGTASGLSEVAVDVVGGGNDFSGWAQVINGRWSFGISSATASANNTANQLSPGTYDVSVSSDKSINGDLLTQGTLTVQ